MCLELDELKEASENLNDVFGLIVKANDQRISHEQTAFRLKNMRITNYKWHEERAMVYARMVERLKKHYAYKQNQFNNRLATAS